MRKYITVAILSVFYFGAHAQNQQGQLVVSPGLAWSGGLAFLETGVNILLNALGHEDMQKTPLINGMVDYGLSDEFSMGMGYSYNKFTFKDSYKIGVDSLGNNIYSPYVITANRQNAGLRTLFHFGEDEDLDIYAGARLGYSKWTITSTAEKINTYNFKNKFTVQALFGVRYYFHEIFGVSMDIGIGNGPYFLGGGISLRI